LRHAGGPADEARTEEYAEGPTKDIPTIAKKALAALEPEDADPQAVANAIAAVVDMPFGKRPFRVHIDPSWDGAELVDAVSDRVRAELLWQIGLEDVLKPTVARQQVTLPNVIAIGGRLPIETGDEVVRGAGASDRQASTNRRADWPR